MVDLGNEGGGVPVAEDGQNLPPAVPEALGAPVVALAESTSAPWVVLVINFSISLIGLILLYSIFQISSTVEWRG